MNCFLEINLSLICTSLSFDDPNLIHGGNLHLIYYPPIITESPFILNKSSSINFESIFVFFLNFISIVFLDIKGGSFYPCDVNSASLLKKSGSDNVRKNSLALVIDT